MVIYIIGQKLIMYKSKKESVPVKGTQYIIKTFYKHVYNLNFSGIGFNKNGYLEFDNGFYIIMFNSKVHMKSKNFSLIRTKLIALCKEHNMHIDSEFITDYKPI